MDSNVAKYTYAIEVSMDVNYEDTNFILVIFNSTNKIKFVSRETK